MFSFHKNESVSLSRQSSVDSLGTLPTIATTESRNSSSSPHRSMHSPEQRKLYGTKRASVFTLRSRSNTANSSTPSLISLDHPDMAEHDEAWHDATSQTNLSRINTRRSFFRGKMSKRLSERVESSMGMSDHKEKDVIAKRASVIRKGKKHSALPEETISGLRHQISSPFDFQHLLHTNRHQAAALNKTVSDKYSAELWATNTSQSKQGIVRANTDQFQFSNFSSEHLFGTDSRSASALSFRSPPPSPVPHSDRAQPDINPQDRTARPALRLARSVESFSQPSIIPRRQQHSQSVTSLPRLNPRANSVEVDHTSRNPARSKRESGIWDHFALSTALTPEDQLSDVQRTSSYFGHALTTPDDSAIHAMTPPFSPSLADVAEEPERFVSPRPAPPPPPKSPTTPKSPFFEDFALNDHQAMVSKPRGRGQSFSSLLNQASPTTRPSSQNSETLGSQRSLRRDISRRSSAARRQSNTWRAIEESWEDDVDFIYENALEADCDFEWDRAPDRTSSIDRAEPQHHTDVGSSHTATIKSEPWSKASASAVSLEEPPSPGAFRASLLVPSTSHMSDLLPTSAASTSISETNVTNSGVSSEADASAADHGFVLNPSLLIPQEYKENGDISYEDLLNEYEGSDSHFPSLNARASTSSSARSSHVRSSRRSSYDSSLISSAQSSGMWSSPVRRSASSAGSVPDLVPSSRRSRKDVGFSLVGDQLSEQVASLRQLNEDEEDDDDATPPGRDMEDRIFFSSEDSSPSELPRKPLEDNLRDSLELARQSSQRFTSNTCNHEVVRPPPPRRYGNQC
ncbi:hypothetical protein ACN47E_005226 [Coniothyrium glycines]